MKIIYQIKVAIRAQLGSETVFYPGFFLPERRKTFPRGDEILFSGGGRSQSPGDCAPPPLRWIKHGNTTVAPGTLAPQRHLLSE